jgi:hypothetical protein
VPSSSSINIPTFPSFSTVFGASSLAGFHVSGERGGVGLNSLSSDNFDDVEVLLGALIKFGFGGTGGFVFSVTDVELGRRGNASFSSETGEISVRLRRGGGTGGRIAGVAETLLGGLIQSASAVGSHGFLGRSGFRIQPSPGGFGIEILADWLLSSHHRRLSDDGGGTKLASTN